MRFAKAGGTEAALAAHFEYTCALGGAERPAYVPVVASGYVALHWSQTLTDHQRQFPRYSLYE
jgi:intermediate cleaving peptidase 55